MLSGVWYMVRVTKKNVLDPNFRDTSFHPSKPCSLPPIHQGVGGGITNINPQLQTHRTELEIVSSSSRNSQAKLQTRKPQIDFPTGHTVRLPASKELLGHTEKEKWAPETEVFVLQLFVSSTEQSTKQILTTCSLSSVCRQGPKPKSRSEILQVSQNTGSRAKHRAQLTEPRGPVTPLPDQEKALGLDLWSPQDLATMSISSCHQYANHCTRTKAVYGRTKPQLQHKPSTHGGGFFSLKEGRKQNGGNFHFLKGDLKVRMRLDSQG